VTGRISARDAVADRDGHGRACREWRRRGGTRGSHPRGTRARGEGAVTSWRDARISSAGEAGAREGAMVGASSIARVGVSLAPLPQRARGRCPRGPPPPCSPRPARPLPARSSTASLSRAPRGRCPRGLAPRRSHALLSAAALACFHRVVLCRVPVGRGPRVPPPPRSPRPGRPLPARPANASLSAPSWSAACRALFHRVAPTHASRRLSTRPSATSRAAPLAVCAVVIARRRRRAARARRRASVSG
jgi:hypothetical protein